MLQSFCLTNVASCPFPTEPVLESEQSELPISSRLCVIRSDDRSQGLGGGQGELELCLVMKDPVLGSEGGVARESLISQV